MAATFLDTLSSLIVSKEEIIEAEEFSKSYLSTLFPDLDLREGVALNDLVIRPNAVLIALIKKGLTTFFTNNSIAGITDDTPEADVDRILSNFFITRQTGTSSIIRVRLYFYGNDRDIYLSANNNFSVDNVVFFQPVTDKFIAKTDLVYDPSRDEYYYDYYLISNIQDESANISSGDLIYHTTVDPYFLQAIVLYQVQKAIAPETNTAMVARAQTAISTRNLINVPSVEAAVRNNFNYFTKVVPIGMGDPEMFRDLISVVNPFNSMTTDQIHIGGKSDVYVNTTVTNQVKQYTVDTNGAVFIEADGVTAEYVAFNVRRATTQEQSDNGLTDTTGQSETYTVHYGGYDVNGDWQPVGDDMDVGLSIRQVVKIQFTNVGATQGTLASFYMDKVEGLLALQNYLDDRVTKVICADYLARTLQMYHLTVNIKKIGNVTLSATELATCDTIVQNFVSALGAGESLVLSNLVQRLVTESGITNLDVNLGVTYTKYDNRFQGLTGTITSSLDPDRTEYFVVKAVTSV